MKVRKNYYAHAEDMIAERKWNQERYEALVKKMHSRKLSADEKDMMSYYREKLNGLRKEIGKVYAPASL